jgi:hypothetical protein
MSVAERSGGAIDCRHCRSPMEIIKTKKYPGRWPLVLVISGVFFTLFFIGALVGIPMLMLGIYMATAKKTISLCPNCGYFFKVWVKEE